MPKNIKLPEPTTEHQMNYWAQAQFHECKVSLTKIEKLEVMESTTNSSVKHALAPSLWVCTEQNIWSRYQSTLQIQAQLQLNTACKLSLEGKKNYKNCEEK